MGHFAINRRLSKSLCFMRIVTAVCVLAVLFPYVSLTASHAQDQNPQLEVGTPTYDGLDLVFLIDQSGSMKDNDPYGLRADTIKWIMEYLGLDNLFSRKSANHRIGIVSFGTGAEIDLPLTSLKLARENWDREINELQANAQAKDMVYTDVLAGLQAVKQVFDEAPPREEGSTASRGVIIISDGAPYRDRWQEDPRYVGTNFYTPYFRDIRDFIDTNLPIAASPRSNEGYHIWVLGLNAKEDAGQASAPGTSWADQQSYWESILNPFASIDRVQRIPGNDPKNTQMPSSVLGILNTMMLGGVCNDDKDPTGTPSCIIEGDFVVPPYVARADFTVSKPDPTSEIAFFTPDGQLLDQDSPYVETISSGKTLETLQVSNPVPGAWRWRKVDASSGTATVIFQRLFAQARMLEPDANRNLFDTATLTLELLDLSDSRIQEVSGYPMDVSARVVAPDGSSNNHELTSQGDGVWKAKETMLLDQPGIYQVYLTGTTADANGEQVYVFRNERSTFSVGNLKPKLVSPPDVVPLFHQFPVQVDLTRADGSQPGVFPRQSVSIEAELVNPDGSVTPLGLKSGSAPNSYQSIESVIAREPGRSVVHVNGKMDFAGKSAQLFDQPLNFRVMAVNPVIASPAGDQPQNGVSTVTIEIKNDTGTPYAEDTSVPWEISAVVQRPDGSSLPPLSLTKIVDGRYEAQFTPDAPGNWSVSTTGTVTLPDGSKTVAFSDLSKTFEVYPTTLVRLNVVAPQQQERQRVRDLPRVLPLPENVIGQVAPAAVVMEFVDASGRPLNLDTLSSSPDDAIVLQLQEPDRPGVSLPITLSVSSENPSQLMAAIPALRQSGEYKLLAFPGALKREYLPEASGPREVVFERYDPWAVITYVLLAIEIMILGVILFLIARAIIVRINPVRGTLEFEKVGGTGGRSSYGTLALAAYGKNTFVIKDSKLRALLEPEAADSLSKLKIKNATERSKSPDEFDAGAGLDGSAIRIWAWGSDRDPIISDEMLANNQSTLLHGDIQMRYHRD